MAPFKADLGLLAHGKVGLEIGPHGLCSNIILFLLDNGLIGQSMHSSFDFFFRSSGVVEDIPK